VRLTSSRNWPAGRWPRRGRCSSSCARTRWPIQKIYLSFPDTGEHGAVYLWETAQAMQAFRASDLARSIPRVYQIEGDPAFDAGEVPLVLREEPARLAAQASVAEHVLVRDLRHPARRDDRQPIAAHALGPRSLPASTIM
jgi:hypothetical protein